MPFYAVREKKTRELVGLFSVEEKAELYWLVEEACPPQDCECALLYNGGVVFPRRVPTLPLASHEDWGNLSAEEVDAVCERALQHREPGSIGFTADVARELDAADGLIWEALTLQGRPAMEMLIKSCLQMV